MQHLSRNVAIAGATMAALISSTAPTQAAAESVRDGNDSSISADIERVRVVHDDTVRVRIKADDLKPGRRHVQGATVYVDVRRARPGPERVIEMGLWKGGDHVVTKARRWHRTGAAVECESSLEVEHRKDVAVLELGPGCLGGTHDRVRVAVATYERIEDEPYTGTDWLTGRRVFTPWVERG